MGRIEVPEKMNDALKMAVDNEVKGRKVYIEMASKASSKVARRVLKFIADQEIKHIDKINELSRKLRGEGAFDYDERAREISKEEIKELFGIDAEKMKQSVNEETSDADAYEKGMVMEEESFKLYEELSRRSKEEKVKRFFELLKREESGHHELLKNALEFSKNPVSWYTENEGWLLEG